MSRRLLYTLLAAAQAKLAQEFDNPQEPGYGQDYTPQADRVPGIYRDLRNLAPHALQQHLPLAMRGFQAAGVLPMIPRKFIQGMGPGLLPREEKELLAPNLTAAEDQFGELQTGTPSRPGARVAPAPARPKPAAGPGWSGGMGVTP